MLYFHRQGDVSGSQLTSHMVVIQWQLKAWQGISDYYTNSSPGEDKSRGGWGFGFLFWLGKLYFWIYCYFLASEYAMRLTSLCIEFVDQVPKCPWPPMWMLCCSLL